MKSTLEHIFFTDFTDHKCNSSKKTSQQSRNNGKRFHPVYMIYHLTSQLDFGKQRVCCNSATSFGKKNKKYYLSGNHQNSRRTKKPDKRLHVHCLDKKCCTETFSRTCIQQNIHPSENFWCEMVSYCLQILIFSLPKYIKYIMPISNSVVEMGIFLHK